VPTLQLSKKRTTGASICQLHMFTSAYTHHDYTSLVLTEAPECYSLVYRRYPVQIAAWWLVGHSDDFLSLPIL